MWSGGYIGLILMCELFIPIVLDLALAPLFWGAPQHSQLWYILSITCFPKSNLIFVPTTMTCFFVQRVPCLVPAPAKKVGSFAQIIMFCVPMPLLMQLQRFPFLTLLCKAWWRKCEYISASNRAPNLASDALSPFKLSLTSYFSTLRDDLARIHRYVGSLTARAGYTKDLGFERRPFNDNPSILSACNGSKHRTTDDPSKPRHGTQNATPSASSCARCQSAQSALEMVMTSCGLSARTKVRWRASQKYTRLPHLLIFNLLWAASPTLPRFDCRELTTIFSKARWR